MSGRQPRGVTTRKRHHRDALSAQCPIALRAACGDRHRAVRHRAGRAGALPRGGARGGGRTAAVRRGRAAGLSALWGAGLRLRARALRGVWLRPAGAVFVQATRGVRLVRRASHERDGRRACDAAVARGARAPVGAVAAVAAAAARGPRPEPAHEGVADLLRGGARSAPAACGGRRGRRRGRATRDRRRDLWPRRTTRRSFATPICVALRRRDRSESAEDAVAILLAALASPRRNSTTLWSGESLVQRFGSALNLNPHLHVLVADGVFLCREDGSTPRFVPTPPPTRSELAAVLRTVAARVARIQKVGADDDLGPLRSVAAARGTFTRMRDAEAADGPALREPEEPGGASHRGGRRARRLQPARGGARRRGRSHGAGAAVSLRGAPGGVRRAGGAARGRRGDVPAQDAATQRRDASGDAAGGVSRAPGGAHPAAARSVGALPRRVLRRTPRGVGRLFRDRDGCITATGGDPALRSRAAKPRRRRAV